MSRWTTLLLLAVALGGCMDQDPFGLAFRPLPGPYELEEFDPDAYYLRGPGIADASGYEELYVDSIGFDARHIVARGDLTRGGALQWVIVDVERREVLGPYSNAELPTRSEVSGITLSSPKAVWRALPTGHRWVLRLVVASLMLGGLAVWVTQGRRARGAA